MSLKITKCGFLAVILLVITFSEDPRHSYEDFFHMQTKADQKLLADGLKMAI